jgi:hypothetical protein
MQACHLVEAVATRAFHLFGGNAFEVSAGGGATPAAQATEAYHLYRCVTFETGNVQGSSLGKGVLSYYEHRVDVFF